MRYVSQPGVDPDQASGMTRKDGTRPTSLIVGAGPVGLMMAVLLARQGLASVVIERHRTRHGAPKAHALNPRTLEICRAIGLDTEAMARRGTPTSGRTTP